MTDHNSNEDSIAFRQWKALDGLLVIDFAIDRRPSDHHPSKATIASGREPREHEVIEITAERWTHVNIAFATGVRLSGGFIRRDNVEIEGEKSVSIFVDIHFGFVGREQMHFEGVIVYCPSQGRPRPPRPPIPPCPPVPLGGGGSDGPAGPVARISGATEVLFPYIFVRDWSVLERDAHRDALIRYSPTSPPNTFLQALEAAQSLPERTKVAEALVKDQTPYKGQFLWDVRQIDSVFGWFPRIADALHRSDEPPHIWLREAQVAINEALERFDQPASFFRSAEYRKLVTRSWESYLALAVLDGFAPRHRDDLARVLWVAHLIEFGFEIKDGELKLREIDDRVAEQLRHAMILLPEWMFERDEKIASGKNWGQLYAVGDLQMVRYRLVGYVAGEIARIDNIMAGERREVRNERLEERFEIDRTQGDDHREFEGEADDERNNLIRQAQRLLGEKVKTKNYANLKTTYGPPTEAELNGDATITTEYGQPSKVFDSSSFARNIVARSVEQVGHSVRKLRARSLRSRTQERVSSIIDNSDRDVGMIATFRWVDQVYETQVVRYGRRLMLEFSIDRPAQNFISRHDEYSGHLFRKPRSPAVAFGIKSFEDINSENYAEVCAAYKVTDIRPPPADVAMIGTTLRGDDEQQLTVPVGFQTFKAKAYCTASIPGVRMPSVRVGSVELADGKNEAELPTYGDAMPIPVSMASPVPGAYPLSNGPSPEPPSPPPPTPPSLPLTHSLDDQRSVIPSAKDIVPAPKPDRPASVETILTNVEIYCEPTPRAISEWQIAIYRAIIEGWEAETRDYYRRIEQSSPRAGAAINPRYVRNVEQSELKAACIELLLAAPIAGDPPNPTGDDVLQPQLVQFLDEAIEWGEMSYEFSGKHLGKAKEPDLSEDEAPFARFLQASRARVLVPVSPVRLRAFLYFWATGQIWDGPNWLVPIHQDHVALVLDVHGHGELHHPDTQDCWQVLVPTAMQILDEWADELASKPVCGFSQVRS